MTAIKALIIPYGDAGLPDSPDNSLPPGLGGGRPDNSLPGGRPPHPWFPGNGNYPSTGPIVPPSGGAPGFPSHPWVPPPFAPDHPIVIPPDSVAPGTPSHPIYIPGSPDHPWVPPTPVRPEVPTHPIVLPPLPGGQNFALALVLMLPEGVPPTPGTPLPGTPPGTPGTPLPPTPTPKPTGVPANAKAAVIYFGPGTLPTVAWVLPPAAPK